MTVWLMVFAGAVLALALILDAWVWEQDKAEPMDEGWWE